MNIPASFIRLRNLVDCFIVVMCLVIFWSCANKVSPTGGPKDKTPPKLVLSIPETGQKNYKQPEISLTFDEYIAVKNLKNQLIITPRIDFKYSYKIKKNKITLKFDSTFNDSTTYTLNFRDGIIDITEGTAAVDMVIAFSTGNELDTLQIEGKILDLFTQENVSGAVVGIYQVEDTMDIFNSPPLYFTETKKDGTFQFRNIKKDNYRVYSFKDTNKNGFCQSGREAYGFLSDTLRLDSNLVLETIPLLYLNIDSFQVSRTRLSGRYFLVMSNKYITEASVHVKTNDTLYYNFTEEHDGLKFYNTFPIQDSLLVNTTLTDSLFETINYDFYLQFKETTRRKDKFSNNLKVLPVSLEKQMVIGNINFSKPIRSFYADSLFVERDSLEFYKVDSIAFKWNNTRTHFDYRFQIPHNIIDTLTHTRQPGDIAGKGKKEEKGLTKRKSKRYTLKFPKATFISIEEDSSTNMKKELKFIKSEKLGKLRGTITTSWASFTLQLLDKSYEVIREQENGSSFVFENIPPAEYLLRILIDRNENGRWDPGDILRNLTPEPVIIYKDDSGNSKTSVRAKWVVDVQLTF